MPSSFLDLDKLCVVSRSVQVLDSHRIGHVQTHKGGPVMALQSSSSGWFGGTGQRGGRGMRGGTSVVPSGYGRVLICYGCGQAGHIRRFCTGVSGIQRMGTDATVQPVDLETVTEGPPAVPKNGSGRGGLP